MTQICPSRVKRCFKCDEVKSLSMFYKHSLMKDGHLNKCMDCTKIDALKRSHRLREDPEWMEKERARGREKYRRLEYGKKYKPHVNISNYRNVHKRLNIPKGKEAHHWSYAEENLLDVIVLDRSTHKRLHLLMERCGDVYRCKETGNILDKEGHLQLLSNFINLNLIN